MKIRKGKIAIKNQILKIISNMPLDYNIQKPRQESGFFVIDNDL